MSQTTLFQLKTISGSGKNPPTWRSLSDNQTPTYTPTKCCCCLCQLRVCVCVTFSTSPRYVLSYLGASQESGSGAPRSSANSLLMHHLCPCTPCGLRPLGSLAALKLCLVGRRKTKLCRYSNWRETGAKCCSNATSALSLLTFNRLGVGCPGSSE